MYKWIRDENFPEQGGVQINRVYELLEILWYIAMFT